jgi:hypothetical protein
MRIWSIHPCYLDAKGLVAAWREGLLAQKVLEGKTKGYINHPQLIRFRENEKCLILIGRYLSELYKEAKKRGYQFDGGKINYYRKNENETIKVACKQIEYEFELLKWKLEIRDKVTYDLIKNVKIPKTNIVFKKIEGDIEKWEKPIQEILNRMNY